MQPLRNWLFSWRITRLRNCHWCSGLLIRGMKHAAKIQRLLWFGLSRLQKIRLLYKKSMGWAKIPQAFGSAQRERWRLCCQNEWQGEWRRHKPAWAKKAMQQHLPAQNGLKPEHHGCQPSAMVASSRGRLTVRAAELQTGQAAGSSCPALGGSSSIHVSCGPDPSGRWVLFCLLAKWLCLKTQRKLWGEAQKTCWLEQRWTRVNSAFFSYSRSGQKEIRSK